jgi:hypothetical protein
MPMGAICRRALGMPGEGAGGGAEKASRSNFDVVQFFRGPRQEFLFDAIELTEVMA